MKNGPRHFFAKLFFYQKYFFMSCLIITSTLFPLKQTNISLNMRTLLFICGILLFASFTKSKYRQLYWRNMIKCSTFKVAM